MNAPELRDIHLPEASLWWPPAPGWWLLVLLLLMLLLALPYLLRWLRYQPPKRIAGRELVQIRRLHEAGRDPKLLLRDLTALLRRVSISYYGRSTTAAMTGEAWCRRLQQLAPAAMFDEDVIRWLCLGRYQPAAEIDVDHLLSACERWVSHLPRSPDRVSA